MDQNFQPITIGAHPKPRKSTADDVLSVRVKLSATPPPEWLAAFRTDQDRQAQWAIHTPMNHPAMDVVEDEVVFACSRGDIAFRVPKFVESAKLSVRQANEAYRAHLAQEAEDEALVDQVMSKVTFDQPG